MKLWSLRDLQNHKAFLIKLLEHLYLIFLNFFIFVQNDDIFMILKSYPRSYPSQDFLRFELTVYLYVATQGDYFVNPGFRSQHHATEEKEPLMYYRSLRYLEERRSSLHPWLQILQMYYLLHAKQKRIFEESHQVH